MQYKDIFKGDDSGQDANTAKDALAKDDIYISQEYISPRPLAKRPFIEITKVRKEGVSDRNIYQSSLLSVLKSWTLTASLGGAQFCCK